MQQNNALSIEIDKSDLVFSRSIQDDLFECLNHQNASQNNQI